MADSIASLAHAMETFETIVRERLDLQGQTLEELISAINNLRLFAQQLETRIANHGSRLINLEDAPPWHDNAKSSN